MFRFQSYRSEWVLDGHLDGFGLADVPRAVGELVAKEFSVDGLGVGALPAQVEAGAGGVVGSGDPGFSGRF